MRIGIADDLSGSSQQTTKQNRTNMSASWRWHIPRSCPAVLHPCTRRFSYCTTTSSRFDIYIQGLNYTSLCAIKHTNFMHAFLKGNTHKHDISVQLLCKCIYRINEMVFIKYVHSRVLNTMHNVG